jgi:PPOX class probable F420-dependent enzyme
VPKPPLPPDVVEMLRRPNPAVMGTANATGEPITAATWYLWQDGEALINFDAERARVAHVRAQPHVSLTVLPDDDWYSQVTLRGEIRLVDDADLADIDRVSRHYTGEPYPDRDRARVSGLITVEHWHGWGRFRRA